MFGIQGFTGGKLPENIGNKMNIPLPSITGGPAVGQASNGDIGGNTVTMGGKFGFWAFATVTVIAAAVAIAFIKK